MRIAVCAPQVPFVRGGAELMAEDLVAALRERGLDVPAHEAAQERLQRPAFAHDGALGRDRPEPLRLISHRKANLCGGHVRAAGACRPDLLLQPRKEGGDVCRLLRHCQECKDRGLRLCKRRGGVGDHARAAEDGRTGAGDGQRRPERHHVPGPSVG